MRGGRFGDVEAIFDVRFAWRGEKHNLVNKMLKIVCEN